MHHGRQCQIHSLTTEPPDVRAEKPSGLVFFPVEHFQQPQDQDQPTDDQVFSDNTPLV